MTIQEIKQIDVNKYIGWLVHVHMSGWGYLWAEFDSVIKTVRQDEADRIVIEFCNGVTLHSGRGLEITPITAPVT
ncbi:MAG: hypothetical protein JWO13_801 [Acidobacteriales bacterium]|nr:hypothetical protein [Terriglobales bacterium]